MKTYNTNSANPTLTTIIKGKYNELLKNGQLHYDNLGDEGVKEVGKNAYIEDADEDKYNALNLLYSLISIKEELPAHSLYEFPGLTMNGQKMKLVIPVTKAFEMADKAKYLEEKLSDYGLKFPAQLYQLSSAYRGKTMPGKDFPPPVPKTMDKSDAEYEKYVEEFYKAHGIEKVSDGLAFRKPYEHEQIDYSKGDQKDPNYTNEYYQDQLERHAKGKGKTISAKIGEKLKVRLKSLASPELKMQGDKVVTSLNWQKIKSNSIKIAAVGAGVVGAAILLNSNPLAAAMIGTAFGIGALTRYVRKKLRERKTIRRLEAEEAKQKQQEANREKAKAKAKSKEAGSADLSDMFKKAFEPGGPRVKSTTKSNPTPGTPPKPGTTTTGTADLSDMFKKAFDKSNPEPGIKPNPPVTPVGNNGGNGGGKNSTPVSEPVINDPVNTDEDLAYDLEGLALAEEDLSLDNTEFNLVNSNITLLRAQITELEAKASTEEEKQALHALKEQEVELLERRLEIAKILVAKQQILLDNLNQSARKR